MDMRIDIFVYEEMGGGIQYLNKTPKIQQYYII